MASDSDQLNTRFRFPPPESADEDGFVAVGGDFAPGTLLAAYRSGIFPWTTRPITWWSPDPRAIIEPTGLHVSRSLRRFIDKGVFDVRFDGDFRGVMEGCAAPRPGRMQTWISGKFIAAYCRLFEMGHAHSVEVRHDGSLVGGLYGVSIGGFFAGESMFSSETNASKVALAAVCARLARAGFVLFDVQMMTRHLASMGAVEIPREEYLHRLAAAVVLERSFGGEGTDSAAAPAAPVSGGG